MTLSKLSLSHPALTRATAVLTSHLNDLDRGRFLCDVFMTARRQDERLQIVDCLHDAYGFEIDSESLVETKREDAVFIVTMLLAAPIWDTKRHVQKDAQALTEELFELVGSNPSFYSTYHYTVDHSTRTYSASGVALLDNSFDIGVVAVGEKGVSVVWFGDED